MVGTDKYNKLSRLNCPYLVSNWHRIRRDIRQVIFFFLSFFLSFALFRNESKMMNDVKIKAKVTFSTEDSICERLDGTFGGGAGAVKRFCSA